MNLRKCETTEQGPTTASDSSSFPNHSPVRKWFLFRSLSPSVFPKFLLRLALLTVFAFPATTHACGPFFPNNLLSSGDEALLASPIANFRRELERLNLSPSRFDHVAVTNDYEQQTLDEELADLAAALKKIKVPGEEAATIIAAHRKNRDALQRYREELGGWKARAWMDKDERFNELRGAAPSYPSFADVPGLPGEFTDYFAGVVALRSPEPDRNAALKAWEQLLERPTTERKYKSTWAAFMLGKLWDEEDDDKAIAYFQMTRDLAKKKFNDSAGLAVAAIGLEARVELRRDHFKRAIELYLEQYAAGDESAVQSLHRVAERAVNTGGEELTALATTPNPRAVITAYLISGHTLVDSPTGDAPAIGPVAAWLAAVETAGLKDVDAAERLALAAYQTGEFELAERWIKRARNSAVAQWLQAKLFLRAGKIPQAAALLAKVAHALPVGSPSELTNSSEFVDGLQVPNNSDQVRTSREQVLGELGALSLSRGEFPQALDALLRANFWEDAAYVAERVLTVEELKAYVDREWPATPQTSRTNSLDIRTEADVTVDDVPTTVPAGPEQFRYLLARRLTRESRGREAQSYFPLQMQARCGELLQALDAGWNEAEPAEQRAHSLFAAARIARVDGMELLGTELAPDWFIHGGSYDWGLTWEDRSTNKTEAKINIASEAELNRAAQHRADPEQRFHYRFQAAFLAWEAAKLLPDNSAETARVLCTAGSWLKNRDPETADLFYKALVRRCRKTAIGEQADRMRWFPVLDEAGNPKPYHPQPDVAEPPERIVEAEPTPSTTEADDTTSLVPAASDVYLVHQGDSILTIARAATKLGRNVSISDLLQANPDMDPRQLRVGQKILIPAPATPLEPSVPATEDNLGIAPPEENPLPSRP